MKAHCSLLTRRLGLRFGPRSWRPFFLYASPVLSIFSSKNELNCLVLAVYYHDVPIQLSIIFLIISNLISSTHVQRTPRFILSFIHMLLHIRPHSHLIYFLRFIYARPL